MAPFRVLISGGTHGNERAGIHLLRLFAAQSGGFPLSCKHLDIQTIIANPKAVALSRRYVDEGVFRVCAPWH